MARTSTLDTIGAADEQVHFDRLEARLVDEFGADCRSTIHTLIAKGRERFAKARVHAFLPILVEREVRSELNSPDQ
jgi:hypothetical protein